MFDVVQVALYLILLLLPVIMAFRGLRDKAADSSTDTELPTLESMQLAPRPRPTRKKDLTRHSVTTLRR